MLVNRGNKSEIYAYMECDDTECVWREADTNSDKSFICSYNQGLCDQANSFENVWHVPLSHSSSLPVGVFWDCGVSMSSVVAVLW